MEIKSLGHVVIRGSDHVLIINGAAHLQTLCVKRTRRFDLSSHLLRDAEQVEGNAQALLVACALQMSHSLLQQISGGIIVFASLRNRTQHAQGTRGTVFLIELAIYSERAFCELLCFVNAILLATKRCRRIECFRPIDL